MNFTIRDLMLVTLIVAILTAWWLDRAARREFENRTAEEIKKAEDDRWQVQHLEKQLVIARRGLESQQEAIEYLKSKLPKSQAPAPNPPSGSE
jgi:hypothetical protein